MKEEIFNESTELLAKLDFELSQFMADKLSIYPFDVKETLLKLKNINEDLYYERLKLIPNELSAEILPLFPSHLQEEASAYLGINKLAKITEEMDTDDAADFLQNISEGSDSRAENILGKINAVDQKMLRSLISYEENVAGSYMQKELFSVIDEEIIEGAIERLRIMKKNGEIDTLSKVFITDKKGRFLHSIGLDELILQSPVEKFSSVLVNKTEITANHLEDIKDVIEKVTDYNLSVLPVLDDEGLLIGRITSDDIYDVIESVATDEMYGMAGLNADVEQAEDIKEALKTRALWLGVNLITAVLASVVIAKFDSTIQSFVSLAILMPIVASMGGNAGTQSLTVTVRKLSIGDIKYEDALDTIKREVSLSILNGLIFSVVIGGLANFWFGIPMLGVVIAISTILNLFIAGFSGAIVPLLLDKSNIDPAVSSTVILTTITDIVGFLSFLWLAKILL